MRISTREYRNELSDQILSISKEKDNNRLTILEIGVALGDSLLAIYDTYVSDLIVGIDLFPRIDNIETIEVAKEKLNHCTNTMLIRAPGEFVHNTFPSKIDILHLDVIDHYKDIDSCPERNRQKTNFLLTHYQDKFDYLVYPNEHCYSHLHETFSLDISKGEHVAVACPRRNKLDTQPC